MAESIPSKVIYVGTYCRIKIGRFYRNELCHSYFSPEWFFLTFRSLHAHIFVNFFVLSVLFKFSKIKNKKQARISTIFFLSSKKLCAFLLFFSRFLLQANLFFFLLLFIFEIKMNKEKRRTNGSVIKISNFYSIA